MKMIGTIESEIGRRIGVYYVPASYAPDGMILRALDTEEAEMIVTGAAPSVEDAQKAMAANKTFLACDIIEIGQPVFSQKDKANFFGLEHKE